MFKKSVYLYSAFLNLLSEHSMHGVKKPLIIFIVVQKTIFTWNDSHGGVYISAHVWLLKTSIGVCDKQSFDSYLFEIHYYNNNKETENA